MLFQYWVASKSKPILAGEQLDKAVTPVVSSHLEVVHRMTCLWAQKAGKTFADVSRLWHRHDIRLLIRGRAYTAVGRLVLLSGLETCLLGEDARRPSVFEHGYLNNFENFLNGWM